MRLQTIVVISSVLLSASCAFWYSIGWNAHRVRAPDQLAMLDEARGALAVEDWDRAQRLASTVERNLRAAEEIVERAERMKEDRPHADEFAAAAAAGHWEAALEAYENLSSESHYRQRYAALHEQVREKGNEALMAAARRSFAAHDCRELRHLISDARQLEPSQSSGAATLLTRCYRERTEEELIRGAEAGDLDDRERSRLLTVIGAERPRALSLLGEDQCERDDSAAEIVWRSLNGADRRAFAHGCALAGVALPLR